MKLLSEQEQQHSFQLQPERLKKQVQDVLNIAGIQDCILSLEESIWNGNVNTIATYIK